MDSHVRRIEAAEMRFLYTIAGFSLPNHQTKEHMLNKPRINNITILDSCRNNWHEHVIRINTSRMSANILAFTSRGRRNVATPKKNLKNLFVPGDGTGPKV